ncbi:N-acetylglucosamine-6-phosphate deacetylase [Anaerorhabdus sp.]|uniref:N-acetylglucosamine-6-phosphate deacetylase n=1 Tax=Anaerorhabdus sp. TaxID=1872524 RepID=UPI002FCB8CE1
MIIKSSRIYSSNGIVDGYIYIENGKISNISDVCNGVVDKDYGSFRIIPGIIDTHNHGTMGYGLMADNENREKIVRGYLKGVASQGVTACLPTSTFALFETIADVAKTKIDGAKPIGIHSEGPYLNRVGEKGIDTGHPNIDLKHCQDMVDKAQGMLKLVAIAPELPNAKEAIELFNKNGVRCAFAHSNAMFDETMESFKWGITVTTHTANVMAGIHHRNMGGLGACLLNDDVYNELIADGLHVSNEMMEIMLRVKKNAYDKVLLVSDNVPMSGAPIGRYILEGMFEVNIDDDGYCLTDTGRLCGSTLPVIRGIENLVTNMNIPLEDAIKMSSKNPAMVYGAVNKGELSIGKDADFVVIDNDFNVKYTYSEGVCVYDYVQDKNLFYDDFMEKCFLV